MSISSDWAAAVECVLTSPMTYLILLVVHSLSQISLFARCSTISQSLLKFLSIESVMVSSHLILCCLLLLLPSLFPTSGSFPASQFFISGGQSIGASASAAVLPMNIQGWFPLGLTSLISLQSKGLSRVFSNSMIWKHKFFSAQPSLWSNMSIPDYWKNHSFDCMDLCGQSSISAF